MKFRGYLIVESPQLWVGASILALLAGTPLILKYFPTYLPGYIIQIPAIFVLYIYHRRLNLWKKYRRWTERALLILAFSVPLQNTFLVKAYRKALLDQHIMLEVFRPDFLLLIGLAAWLYYRRKQVDLPAMLVWSFWLGLAGWLVATGFSEFPLLSIGNGLFEFLSFWIAIYVLLGVAPERQFPVHAAVLFCLGVGLVAIAQTTAIWSGISRDAIFGIPIFAQDFLKVKMDLDLMIQAGGNGYGNTDNFASLCTLVLPLLAGLAYVEKRGWMAWLAFALLAYAGLLVYSRASTATVFLALCGLWFFRLIACNSFSIGLIVALFGFVVIHAGHEMSGYYAGGVQSFSRMLLSEPRSADHGFKESNDASGLARADAWRRGVSIARTHWLTGIGYGVYPIADPEYTAPHSMVLLRLVEGGLLSLLSFLLLILYVPIRLIQILKLQEQGLPIAALVSVASFLFKAAVFGGSFAINGQIAWGFGVALMLSMGLVSDIADRDVPVYQAGAIV